MTGFLATGRFRRTRERSPSVLKAAAQAVSRPPVGSDDPEPPGRSDYDKGRRVRIFRLLGSCAFPLAALVVQIGGYGLATVVGAGAGAWLLFDRTIARWLEDRFKRAGATAQHEAEIAMHSQWDSEALLLDQGRRCAKAASYYRDYEALARSYWLVALAG